MADYLELTIIALFLIGKDSETPGKKGTTYWLNNRPVTSPTIINNAVTNSVFIGIHQELTGIRSR